MVVKAFEGFCNDHLALLVHALLSSRYGSDHFSIGTDPCLQLMKVRFCSKMGFWECMEPASVTLKSTQRVECVQGADFLFGLCKGNFLAVFCVSSMAC
jgi:hypothetical protein